MPYTHTFELNVGGTSMEGEISFNGGQPPRFKTDNGEEMTLAKHKNISLLLEQISDMCHNCGEIIKIEIVKK